MLPLATLTVVRTGRVTFQVRGPYHCGPADAALRVQTVKGQITLIEADYTFTVVCAPSLDKRGFLFNQVQIQTFAQNTAAREAYASCEHLLIDLGTAFQERIARDVPTCQIKGLTVELSPAPYKARLQARWGGDPL